MDTTVSDPMVGRLLEGRYSIESFIAHGGMAAVYLATDTRLERRVAVKVMHAHLSEDPETLARFEREARAAARLSHPDVVAVYDQGTDNGRAFLVMEFVPGANLRAVLRDQVRLTPERAVAVMDHVLAALAAAHAAGLVHRDVKPENVLVTADGRVKVADFGLARAVAGSTVTTTGSVLLGTAAYIAPEQFIHGVADARSDVYSAGVMFFELLTGGAPFEADSAYSLLNRHANEDIPAPSTRAGGIPLQLDALVTWATSRDPQQRPADAGELLESLVDVRDRLDLHGSVPTPPISLTERYVDAPPDAGRGRGGTQIDRRFRPPGGSARAAGSARAGGPAGPTGRRKGRRRWRPRKWMVWTTLFALIVALAGVGGWWFAAGRYTHSPSLTGLSRTQADAQLAAAGLHPNWLHPVHSLLVPPGEVVSASPNDARVVKGSTVDLVLSSGPKQHSVPPLSGLTVAGATSTLKTLGLSVGKVTKAFSMTIHKGEVISSDPSTSATVSEGTSVALTVSNGKEHVAVPSVAGLAKKDAIDAINAAGLQVAVISQFSSSTTAGNVISSTPTAGKHPVKGSDVTLYVSKGPKLYVVPSEVDLPLTTAIHHLRALGFNPVGRPILSLGGGGTGTVIKQIPDSGMEPHGYTIILRYF